VVYSSYPGECGAGWVVDCDDPEAIFRQLQSAMLEIATIQGAEFAPSSSKLKYSRPVLTRQLVELFEVASGQGTGTPSRQIP
jgi:hypothetical protein